MAKNEIKISANVADTKRASIAGAKEHPGWHALRTIAGRITTPLLPDDYLKLANPLWSARELRGRVVEVRRETVDSATLVIKPGWGFSLRLRTRPVRRHRPAGRRPLAVAVVLADVDPGRGGTVGATTHHHDHRQGDARGLPVDPPRRRRRAGHHRAAGGAAGQLRDARSGARIGAVPDRGLGHHAGDVDAAHAGAPRSDHRHRPRAFGANGIRRDVRRRAGRAGTTRTPGYRLRLRATRTEGRLDLSRLADEVPDWRDRQTWACGPEAMLNDAAAGLVGGGRRRAAAPRALRGRRARRRTAPAAP